MASTLSLVSAGLGVSIVPEAMGRLGTTGVSYRRLRPEDAPVAPLVLAWRSGEESGPLGRLVRDVQHALATRKLSAPRP